jgi:hypothetical protein
MQYSISIEASELQFSIYNSLDVVTWQLKAGILEQIDATIARQRCCKHVSAATDMHATVEKLLDAMFFVWAVPRLYIEDQTEAKESVRAGVLKTPRAVRQ